MFRWDRPLLCVYPVKDGEATDTWVSHDFGHLRHGPLPFVMTMLCINHEWSDRSSWKKKRHFSLRRLSFHSSMWNRDLGHHDFSWRSLALVMSATADLWLGLAQLSIILATSISNFLSFSKFHPKLFIGIVPQKTEKITILKAHYKLILKCLVISELTAPSDRCKKSLWTLETIFQQPCLNKILSYTLLMDKWILKMSVFAEESLGN